MYYKSRKLAAARKRMKEELVALGWTEHECRYKANGTFDIRVEYKTPHIDNNFFWFENCLKKINTGEAYWALESYALQLEHLAWRCNDDNPNNHNYLDTLDAFELARRMILRGIDFNYYAGSEDEIPEDEEPEDYSGHINIIDWEHPERNTFEFAQGWHGGLNDGFGWDFVLFVNAIPVGAIILEADEEPDSDGKPVGPTLEKVMPCQKALDVAQLHLDCDFQFPVYCHALILSNGKQILNGDPWMELDEFTPISSLSEALQPLVFLENRIRHIEEVEEKD